MRVLILLIIFLPTACVAETLKFGVLSLEIDDFWEVEEIDHGYQIKIPGRKGMLEITGVKYQFTLNKQEIIGNKGDPEDFKYYGDLFGSSWSRWDYSDMRHEYHWSLHKENEGISLSIRYSTPNEIAPGVVNEIEKWLNTATWKTPNKSNQQAPEPNPIMHTPSSAYDGGSIWQDVRNTTVTMMTSRRPRLS